MSFAVSQKRQILVIRVNKNEEETQQQNFLKSISNALNSLFLSKNPMNLEFCTSNVS